MKYRYNPSCGCARCRAHGFMGPAILITIGILFLIDQVTHIYWMEFGRTWPALLIVIGLVMFLQHNAPATGHIPREFAGYPQGQPPQQPQAWQPPQQQWQPPQQQQWQPPAAQQPPAASPSAGSTDEGEVRHG